MLTEKQKRFCDEYLIDLNGTRAYKAVYGAKTDNAAAASANRLLRNVKISAYLAEKQQTLQVQTGITQERVLGELAKIAFFDIRKLYDDEGRMRPIAELEDEVAGAINSVESYEETTQISEETFSSGTVRKIKTSDKIKALEQLGRHLGIFEKDNGQRKTEIPAAFKVDIVSPKED